MSTMPSTSVRFRGLRTVLVALALVAAAPAQGWAQSRFEQAPAVPVPKVRMHPLLKVENNNWLDVHLYLVRDGMLTSLGFINGPGKAEFNLPTQVTMAGSDVQILVLPIGGLDSYLSPALVVNPWDVVSLVVENNLDLSYMTTASNH